MFWYGNHSKQSDVLTKRLPLALHLSNTILFALRSPVERPATVTHFLVVGGRRRCSKGQLLLHRLFSFSLPLPFSLYVTQTIRTPSNPTMPPRKTTKKAVIYTTNIAVALRENREETILTLNNHHKLTSEWLTQSFNVSKKRLLSCAQCVYS